MQGIVLQTGLCPSKDDNAAVLTIMSSETGWDDICQAILIQISRMCQSNKRKRPLLRNAEDV